VSGRPRTAVRHAELGKLKRKSSPRALKGGFGTAGNPQLCAFFSSLLGRVWAVTGVQTNAAATTIGMAVPTAQPMEEWYLISPTPVLLQEPHLARRRSTPQFS